MTPRAPRASTTAAPQSGLPPAMAGVTGFLVNRVAEELRLATAARLEDLDVRPRQLGLLLMLRDEGRSQQQALGERLGMDRTTTMQLVTDLEARGLLLREEDPTDRRAYLLGLTARGNRVADQVEHRARAAADEVLAPLSASESRTLHRLLVKLLSAERRATAETLAPRARTRRADRA